MLRKYLARTHEHMFQEGIFSLLIFNSWKIQQACGREGRGEEDGTHIACLAVTSPSPSQRSCLIYMHTEKDGQALYHETHYPGLSRQGWGQTTTQQIHFKTCTETVTCWLKKTNYNNQIPCLWNFPLGLWAWILPVAGAWAGEQVKTERDLGR